ncbi:hypothetical protein QR685DRAFT_419373, partial [Neurospora intermedia]
MGVLPRFQLVSDFWFPCGVSVVYFFSFVHVVISVLLSTFCLYYVLLLCIYDRVKVSSKEMCVWKRKKKWIYIDFKFSQKE